VDGEFDNMPEEDSVISPEGKKKIEDAFEEKLKQAALANLKRFQKEEREKQELMELGEEPPKLLN
jgi:ubiquinone biosynthesis protein COQ9